MLLGVIKEATRAHHNALEADLDIQACLSSRASWLWLLETFSGYWVPVEAALFAPPALAGWLPDAHLRLKSALLSRDIEALGGDAPRTSLCPELPPLTSLAEKFGSLYVLEGATLGGQIISRLASGHGYTPERGCAFFASYEGKIGPMWKTFCVQLEAYGTAHPHAHDVVVASAVETFARFGSWISRRKCGLAKTNDYAPKR